MVAPPCSRTWTLLPLLTESELRALFAQVQQELATRHGQGAPLLVDVLTADEARLLTEHRATRLLSGVGVLDENVSRAMLPGDGSLCSSSHRPPGSSTDAAGS